MDDLTFFEIERAVIWLATSPALWKLIDRQSRPGPIKNASPKESLMLIHLALLHCWARHAHPRPANLG